jgi:hypothetical protein
MVGEVGCSSQCEKGLELLDVLSEQGIVWVKVPGDYRLMSLFAP